ncbi:hypothetical protein [Amedibacterium intestinale]|uniref:hypothetical protein n=1 Tax=Amedibacterium intestinale TaxID=2583452 RepID=UPI000E20C481
MDKNKIEKGVSKNPKMHIFFYVLSILMLFYLIFTAYTSYQTFIDYCKSYNYQASDQWFLGFQSILASIIPCLVYASTLYGLGYLIQSKGKREL